MTKYLLVYHGGGQMPASEEEGKKVMQAWMAWFGSLGGAVVDGGNPVGASKTMHPGGKVTDGGGANAATGYSVIEAKDDADIAKKAKGCPHLADGGTIEIAPIMEM
ncbi:MAG: YciI family protein [Rhizobiaceae bacterium]